MEATEIEFAFTPPAFVVQSNPHLPMKNIAIIILLLVSLTLGALMLRQQKQTAQTQAALAQVQTELGTAQTQLKANTEAAAQIANAKRSSKILQETLVETSKFADEKAKQAEDLKVKLAAAQTNTNNPMANMAKMFSDPKMKEMIKAQQKTVLGPMIAKQYGDLFQQLNLSADDSTQLKNLLLNKMLAGADAGMSMLDDSLDATNRAALGKQVKAATDDYETQIKDFLRDGYASYQSYEKTVPDRTEVNQFGDQLTGDNAMKPEQQAQLIQALSEARNGFKWTTDYTDNNKLPADGDFAGMFSEEKLDKFTQEKEQFDQQFLERAQKILNPEQAKSFAEFQSNQRQMQIMGMKMAASMFGGKK